MFLRCVCSCAVLASYLRRPVWRNQFYYQAVVNGLSRLQ
jgi:hypothetical protein